MRIFQYLYEYQGDIGSSSKNLLFHLFEVDLISEGRQLQTCFSPLCEKPNLSCLMGSLKDFKEDYFLVTPISPLSHNFLHRPIPVWRTGFPCLSDEAILISIPLQKECNDYSVSCKALIDSERTMKETLLSFFDFELCCQVIFEAWSYDEMNKLFGTPFIPTLLIACELTPLLFLLIFPFVSRCPKEEGFLYYLHRDFERCQGVLGYVDGFRGSEQKESWSSSLNQS